MSRTLCTQRLFRSALAACLAWLCGALLIGAESPGPATEADSLDDMVTYSANGVILPDEPLPADLNLHAVTTYTWQTQGTQHLLLDGNARIEIGSYGFKANRAVVVLTPIQVHGRKVRRMALYLDKVSEIGGYGPISAEAPRLLVTAVLEGRVELKTDKLTRKAATNDPLVVSALNRTAKYYQALAQNTVDVPAGDPLYTEEVFAQRNDRQKAIRGEVAAPVVVVQPGAEPPVEPGEQPGEQPPVEPIAVEPGQEPRIPAELAGQIDFGADRVVYQGGAEGEEGTVLLVGNIRVMYHDPAAERSVSLTADKAVIFTAPDAGQGENQKLAKFVNGIYLEDNVIATDGQYTLRGPRIFYDLQRNKAIVLDGVFYTWDIRQQVPIYVRARTVRQESDKRWHARGAMLSANEFATPHLSLRAKDLTVRREDQPNGRAAHHVKADKVTLNMGEVPIFYWPTAAGRATETLLRGVGLDVDSRDGAIVRTEWDLFGLMGKDKPEGVDASLLVDAYTMRGGAVGTEMQYDVPKAYGNLDGYLMVDFGDDEPGGREEVTPPNEIRGRINWRHRHFLPDNWQATLELGYLADPTFLEEFFPEEAYADKPYETLAYFKKQEEDTAFTFLLSYDLMDYPSSMNVLQTPGYMVEKYPEAGLFVIGRSLFDDRVTWYSENRGSIMRLSFPEKAPDDYGFTTAESVALFGIASGTHFDTNFEDMGYSNDTLYRFDTRQELQMPLKIGFLDVVPYVTGRITGYDDDFVQFSGEEDNLRYWGAAGVRLHAAFSRSYDGVENRTFDLHRLRHIIEPSATVFHAATNIEQQNLPVYDYDVESLLKGTVTRIGLRNTLQTQRGGPGRWYSVDWLRLDTDLVIHSGEAVLESPVPRMFDYRPEYSLTGDHFWSEAVWQVTDSLAASGDYTYSFESDETEQWGVGLRMNHNPRTSSFIEARHIDPLRTLYVRYGVEYLLSPKYHVSVTHGYDFDREESRAFSVVITRRMPRMLVMVGVDIDPLTDQHSVGIALAPEGLGGKARRSYNPFLRGATLDLP